MPELRGEALGGKKMVLPLLALVFFVSSPSVELVSAADRLEPGKSVSVNETIVSLGGIFALGFFSPGNSTGKLYAGIWYDNSPEKDVVWVANRDRPLLDPSGILTIARDGNIAVLDAEGSVIWTSNVSGIPSNTTAVLQDNGNFVLRGDGGHVWQSFDHPSDTLLPGMKLMSTFQSDVYRSLTAWRDAGDPYPGKFSFGIDPRLPLQLAVWRGSDIYIRSQVWNGSELGGARDARTLSIYVLSFEVSVEGSNVTFSATEGSTPARFMLDTAGSLRGMVWDERAKNWTSPILIPSRPCDLYNSCGPYGVCNMSSPSLMCSCLQGYEPKNHEEWSKGNSSEGCIRKTPFGCDGGDWFQRASGMKLPDRFIWLRNTSSIEQCKQECLRSCNCTAYAYTDVRSGGIGSRCLLWEGEMLDISQLQQRDQDLYVRLPASALVTTSDQKSSNKKYIPIIVVLPTLPSVIFLIGMCYFLKRRSKRQENGRADKVSLRGEMNSSEAVQSGKDIIDLQFLDFSSLMAATDNFSTDNKLGEGGFGPVYKGRLPQGQDIAVKRLSKNSGQGFEEFKNEVELISRLQHTNLVKLVAWCIHQDEKLLVYEYLPNKSLDKFIFDPTCSIELDWGKRTRIIEGIAQGLLYLHRYSRLRVIHRDLKTSNILLDDAMNPKISDFGLARIFGGNQTEANTNKVVGTKGYMSPEYALNGLFSEKSDVYSFGVIILEIISGKRSTGFYLYDESLTLLGYAWRLWQEGRGLELVDSSIRRTVHEPEVLRLILVGLLCIQEYPADRPMISSVISMLDNEHGVVPSPKHPPLAAVGGDPNLVLGNLSYSKSNQSINWITLSTAQGS